MLIVDKMIVLSSILLISGAGCAVYCNVKLDTLYQYSMGCHEQHLSTKIFMNGEVLESFLQKTEYKNNKAIKKPASTPDFNKQTFFAFSGWPCTIINILEDSTKITLQYSEDCREIDPNDRREYSRPQNVVAVYAVPHTSKKILFKDIKGNK